MTKKLHNKTTTLKTGAELLVEQNFSSLNGACIGLVTNHTARVGEHHLADHIHTSESVSLGAIFAPEHGFRGQVEADTKISHEQDPKTGAPIYSVYGKARKPNHEQLRGIDVLVFDIQDIGARFYTYISTMGLAMQAAAEHGITFIVLDRPNPLGGQYVSGYILEAAQKTFVGQYQIPIVHGLTVGELAKMIKAEGLLDGLESLEISVVQLAGWHRSKRWHEIARPWRATSPNIPTFDAALLYPGVALSGVTDVNEGRGTSTPFSLIGAPWINANALADRLNGLSLPGLKFHPTSYTPRVIEHVTRDPRHENRDIAGVRVEIENPSVVAPLELGIHLLCELTHEEKYIGHERFFANLLMFRALSGTDHLHDALCQGTPADDIIAGWQTDVENFNKQRQHYLLY